MQGKGFLFMEESGKFAYVLVKIKFDSGFYELVCSIFHDINQTGSALIVNTEVRRK